MPLSNAYYDTAIVGGGPAGAIAARLLAARGARVIIIEKAVLPRYKTCGGGVVGRARALLTDSLSAIAPVKFCERECHEAELYFNDQQRCFHTRRATPIVTMFMRAQLDELLCSAAAAAGAQLQTGCTVKNITLAPDNIELLTDQGIVRARTVIAADGALSTIARQLGWPETRLLIPALECEITVRAELLARFTRARFDFGVIANGYGWVFPKRAHLSIGVLATTRGNAQLHQVLNNYLTLLGIDEVIACEKHGALIPVSPRRDRFMHKGVMLVGDAAGFADPVTGEGITHALVSGALAAQSLLAGNFDHIRTRDYYQQKLRAEILPELRAARLLAKFLYNYPRVRSRLFQKHGQRLSEAVTDLVMGERSYRSMLFNPKNYFKILAR